MRARARRPAAALRLRLTLVLLRVALEGHPEDLDLDLVAQLVADILVTDIGVKVTDIGGNCRGRTLMGTRIVPASALISTAAAAKWRVTRDLVTRIAVGRPVAIDSEAIPASPTGYLSGCR